MNRSMTFFLVVIAPSLAIILSGLGLVTLQNNWLGWFLLVMGLAYIIGGPLYAWKKKGEPLAKKEERGDRSFWLVQPGFIIVIFGAPLEYLFLPEVLPRPVSLQIAGMLLIGISLALHAWSRWTIRNQFSGHVQIQPDHHLVKSGPYRFARHPGYSAYLLMAVGVAVGFSSLIACAAVFALLLPGLVYRMNVEERLLVEAFGDEYRRYRNITKRLFPGIW